MIPTYSSPRPLLYLSGIFKFFVVRLWQVQNNWQSKECEGVGVASGCKQRGGFADT